MFKVIRVFKVFRVIKVVKVIRVFKVFRVIKVVKVCIKGVRAVEVGLGKECREPQHKAERAEKSPGDSEGLEERRRVEVEVDAVDELLPEYREALREDDEHQYCCRSEGMDKVVARANHAVSILLGMAIWQ